MHPGHLMRATRSAYSSWDIVVDKSRGKILRQALGTLNLTLTVSETSAEPLQDEGSSTSTEEPGPGSHLLVNHNFSQQCLKTGEDRYQVRGRQPLR